MKLFSKLFLALTLIANSAMHAEASAALNESQNPYTKAVQSLLEDLDNHGYSLSELLDRTGNRSYPMHSVEFITKRLHQFCETCKEIKHTIDQARYESFANGAPMNPPHYLDEDMGLGYGSFRTTLKLAAEMCEVLKDLELQKLSSDYYYTNKLHIYAYASLVLNDLNAEFINYARP